MTAYIKHKSITVLWELSEKKIKSHWNITPSIVRSAHRQVSKSLWSLLGRSKRVKGTSDFCPWLAGRCQPGKKAHPANGPGNKSSQHLALNADPVSPVSLYGNMVPPLFHTLVLKERGMVLLRSWSPGLVQLITLGWVWRFVSKWNSVDVSAMGTRASRRFAWIPLGLELLSFI